MSAASDGRERAHVNGKCPACGSSGLFVGSGGYLTCPWAECPNPSAPHDALVKTPAPAIDPDDPELIGMVARVMAVHRITGVWFPPARCSCGEETGENYADWNAWEAHVAREVSAALKAVAQ